MSLSFVQKYPNTRLISHQRNKDNGKLLLQQLETKRQITEEEERLSSMKANLDPLQKQQHMPWERNDLTLSTNMNKIDANESIRKLMIDVYGQGLKITEEDSQKILVYYQSLSPIEKVSLSKLIKCKQQYYAMETAKNAVPISIPRKSLLDLHKKNEFDVKDRTDDSELKSFPVGNEKYFISEEDLHLRNLEDKMKYRDALHQTSTLTPIAKTKTIINKHSDLGKSRGFIDFNHIRDIDMMKSHNSLPLYAELYNTLSLPTAYRNKIEKMECYK